MTTFALSDITHDRLHHAYGVEGVGIPVVQAIADWVKKNIPLATSVQFSYQTLGINEARQLSSLTKYRTGSEVQIIIITAATITREAQNAMLKLFEEPVSGVHFFLIVPAFSILLPTLRSRLMRVRVDVKNESSFDVQKFISETPSDRLVTIEQLLKNTTTEEESKGSVTRMVLDALEGYCARNTHSERIISAILFVRKYAELQGASHKMLLEYLALNI